MKSLIIESNLGYTNNIKELLSTYSSYEVACDGVEGVYMAESNSYDIIILDLMLPKMSGLDVLRKIREKSICPIIVISDFDDVEKKVESLNLGADDYITKPFDNREFIARFIAVTRRCNNNFYEIYKHKNISLDFKNKMFCIDGKYIKLSGKMYDVLEYLIRNKNIIIPKEQLFNRVWGMDCDTTLSVTEVYVCNLRKTLKKYGEEKYIRTIKNIGYMWEDKPMENKE